MDLTTTYLGLQLKNPIVPSASPLSRSLDTMKRMEDAGASASVMSSLFEEQIAHETAALHHYLNYGTESFAEALTYFPEASEYNLGPEEYLSLLTKATQSLEIPIIASLNGTSAGGWTGYARMLEGGGADALELNIYYIPSNPDLSGDDVEARYMDVLRAVKESVQIPVAVKLGPFFSSFANIAHRLVNAGADGLVLFNRFYQPDIDLEELEVKPGVTLSDQTAGRLPMRWIAILRSRIKASLAATSGIHTAEDLLKHGPEHIASVLAEVERWMIEHEYESITQMKGSMCHGSVADPSAFERANYMKALNRYRLIM
jgi:dihydroorotate dehydrogenase (fumarate)